MKPCAGPLCLNQAKPTSSYCCLKCRRRADYKANPQKFRDAAKRFRLKNPEKVAKWNARYDQNNASKRAAYQLAYSLKNRKRIAERAKKWRAENREKHRRYSQEWLIKNPKKALETKRKYRSKNKAKWLALNRLAAKRRANRLKQATPKWCDLKSLQAVVDNCPAHLTLDHIIPLAGKIVCGLNVPNNLDYIPKEEQNRKSNKFPYTPVPPYWRK